MYWQIEYLGDGEYSLIPINSRDSRLGLDSSYNTDYNNAELKIDDSSNSSIWRITPGVSGGYSLLSKSSFYTKALRTIHVGSVTGVYALSPEIAITDWEFIPVLCPGYTSNLVESFADGHALIPFKHSNPFIRYSCPNCQDYGELCFLSPEEQDKDNLDFRDYALIYGLQKAMLEKLIEQDADKFDAIIRIMNHIRDFYGNDSNNNSKYDFRTETGKFKSNYNFIQLLSYNIFIQLALYSFPLS